MPYALNATRTESPVSPSLAETRWLVAANLLALFAAGGLIVWYLMLNNAATARGFAIRALERQVAELNEQRKTLDIQAATAASLKGVEGRMQAMGFVPVEGVDYIEGVAGAVAVR
ncbi:hypothetical protein A3C96_01745 [Candidatus Uhrbacteria bacterium RIFCSPHIGHO2_02_FULL_60_10]|uniref:Cell division protein FtsL n=1 Tax=Candidatus Uhrbacteria bacterium RIFCSPHIGHO2_02_FULL_60_10 TaxID=1802392 RepID=A0A1F7U8I2_9BACT|nr:MAG: hypothetical protein A3C96_01745 [Candidatus Uhrbacteria bacterium RIFCSPHIGHO2_02_FULL_60_10]